LVRQFGCEIQQAGAEEQAYIVFALLLTPAVAAEVSLLACVIAFLASSARFLVGGCFLIAHPADSSLVSALRFIVSHRYLLYITLRDHTTLQPRGTGFDHLIAKTLRAM